MNCSTLIHVCNINFWSSLNLINNIFSLKVSHLVIGGVVEGSLSKDALFHTKFSKNSNKN